MILCCIKDLILSYLPATLNSQNTCHTSPWTASHRVSHYNDVIMRAMSSQITSLTIVYSTVYSGPDQRKHQSSASLAFAWGTHRCPVKSPHKWPVTRKMFPFDDVMIYWVHFIGICPYHNETSLYVPVEPFFDSYLSIFVEIINLSMWAIPPGPGSSPWSML